MGRQVDHPNFMVGHQLRYVLGIETLFVDPRLKALPLR